MAGVDFERDLNEEQRAAVLAPDGPVLVIAAAGTGKTRTLTYRVVYLVERGVDPRRILLLTFTNRAAREMLERAAALVGDRVGGIWGGTFHHMANRILRRHARHIGLSNDYAILDEDDARGMLRACVSDLGLREKTFPKPELLLSMLGLAISRDANPETIVAERLAHTGVRPEDVLRVFDTYARRKMEANALDFDDLLVRARQLLRECESVRTLYQEQFLHVLVDEYQDTNILQAALVEQLTQRHGNLLVVGDDFQSIYSWRGADFRNFLSFPKHYPHAQVFKLETNYRSVPGILAVANVCIAGNPHQFQKVLRPVRKEGSKPRLVELRDGYRQACYVADEILRLRSLGFALSDMAVLYRSHFHALEAQLELERRGIPFAITSGVRFFEQAHIKDVCALLRLAYTPTDELAFLRWLPLFPSVGPRGATRLWGKMGRRFQPLAVKDRERLESFLPTKAHPTWNAISIALENAGTTAPAALASELIRAFCDAFYREYVTLEFEDADRRLEDIQALMEFTARYPTLGEFLNEITLLTNVDTNPTRTGSRDADRDCVLLSTVHQAKGLEWRVVFILWLTEGLFPSARALADDPSAEEERRLFYVAVTRARDLLLLCVPGMRIGQDKVPKYYSPSRFIAEIPKDLLHRERLTETF